MKVEKKIDGNSLLMVIEGRIDSVTAPQLQVIVEESLTGVAHFTIDLGKVEYISSAGLRVILGAHKTMSRQGTMNLIHVPAAIREVFEITGFDSVLNIEY